MLAATPTVTVDFHEPAKGTPVATNTSLHAQGHCLSIQPHSASTATLLVGTMPATGSSVGPRIGATRPLPRAPTSSSSVSAPPRPQKRTVARTPQPQAAGAGRRGCTGRLRAGGKPAAEAGAAPWSLLFDLRERETEWSDGNQVRTVRCGAVQCARPGPALRPRVTASSCLPAGGVVTRAVLRAARQARLVVAFAAQELGVAEEEVRRKLGELAVLMPDLCTPPSAASRPLLCTLDPLAASAARRRPHPPRPASPSTVAMGLSCQQRHHVSSSSSSRVTAVHKIQKHDLPASPERTILPS